MRQQLVREWYDTDAHPDWRGAEDRNYVGTVSSSFEAEQAGRRIVSVDWSNPGEVEVTWLVTVS